MRQKGIKLLTVLTALALMLNVVLAIPLMVAAEDDGIVKDSIEYPGGKLVNAANNGDRYLLEGDFDVTFSFTNNPFVGETSNWINFIFQFLPTTDTAGITLRADRWGETFGTENASNVPSYLGAVTWNWDNYIQMCRDNTYVTLNVRKLTDNVISAVAEFKSAEGGTTAETMTYAITYPKGIPSSLEMQFGVIGASDIKIWKCVYNTCTSAKTDKEYADKTITGYLTDSASSDKLSGDFRAVYSFKNKSNGTNNWDNFIFDISGSGLSIIARADVFDVAKTLEGCWASDYKWETLVSDMTAGADVTAIIERIGNDLRLFYIIKGNGYTYFATAGKSFAALPDELTVKLSGENVSLSDIKSTIYKLTYTNDKEEDEEYDPSKDTAISYGTTSNRVTVHDPSIVKDEKTGYYYIFGSHMAWARSKDLINWQTFTNNINRNYSKLFADPAKWSARGSSSYDLSGNLWAPDVIWNDTMKKWCMYMSVNGDNFYSSIVLLTADNIEGPYTYVGPVVYSGFTTATAAETDFAKVMGTNTVDERYTRYRNSERNRTYGTNAIDPCVTYDEKGDLWMSYGSWYGGIYMLKLDKTTGLRDYTKTYTLNEGVSDPYQGIKLAGGDHSSGEASYLEKIGDYWYLFMSYGGLVASGGYNMRVFRSESIEGPYVDLSGDKANYASYYNNINGTVGNRLMTYYKWSYMTNGQVAQGHNSAFVDNDGRVYVIYHTRFDDGTEGHQVRVRQLFVNKDGWLVTAPFEYSGEKLSTVSAADVAGKYEVLFHTSTNNESLECVTGKMVTFKEDGTISGAYEGTWKLEGGYYATLTIGGKEYKGVFVEQTIEDQDQETLCFTVIGSDEISVWGYKYPYSNEDFIDMAAEMLDIPIGTFAQNITLPANGLYDVSITWSTSNAAVLAADGKVTVPDKDTVVTLTATITYDGTSKKYVYPVKVFSSKSEETEKYLLWEYFTDENKDLSNATEGSIRYPNPFNADNVLGININNGISIEFEVTPKGAMQYLSNILSLNAGAKGGLYFTGGSYLGYNATGGWFDANVKNTDPWAAGTDFIGSGAKVRIDITSAGFEVYFNDKLAYTQADIGGAVPGGKDISSYAHVLSYLRNTATYLNFGWGSWWDGGFNGTVSNVKLYVHPAEYVDTSGYVYYEDYNSTADTGWTSPNAQGSLTIRNDGDEHGGYVDYAAENVSGNRGAYTNFPEEANLNDRYVVEVDIKMTPGNVADRSVSQFAITGMDAAYDGNNCNNGIISGYILKLSTDISEAGSAIYYINDGEQSIAIPANTWVHIKASVTDGTKVVAEITVNGVTKSFTTEVNGNGVLKGMYLLRGRGSGAASVDNITVTEHSYGEPIRENEVPATCTENGSYDEVIYCTECGEEVSRVTKTIPALGHIDEDKDGYCDRCEVCLHWLDEDGYCTEKDCDHDEDCCPKKPEESNGSINQDVQTGEGAPDIQISMDIEDLKDAVLTDEEKEALESGANVEIIMSVELQENVDPEDKAAIEEAAEGKYAVGMYLELNLDIYINDELSRSVTLLDEPICITVDIPEELLAEGREYVILRLHDGEVDILKDLDSDPNTITFETDRFSTYAIGYSVSKTSEPEQPEQPNQPNQPNQPEQPDQPGSDVPPTGIQAQSAARTAVIILSAAVMCGAVYIRRRPTVKR